MLQEIDIFDLDYTHRYLWSDFQKLTWGARYRHVNDQLRFPADFLSFDPAERTTNLFSAFLQDEITLIDETLFLTFGSKIEHNDFTGFEIQPSARMLWSVDKKHAFWASASRAVRTPSRSNDDARILIGINPVPQMFVASSGDRSVESEELTAYEIGYRAQPTDQVSWDVALFFNDYDNLIQRRALPTVFPPPAFIFGSVESNTLEGETYGVELSSTYEISPCWRIYGSYTYLQMQLHSKTTDDSHAEEDEGSSPHNQVYLQSSWDLPHDLEFDVIGRYVDELPALGVGHYITLDLRLGYRPCDAWEFSVVGHGLLEEHRREYAGSDINNTEVDRGIFAQVVWRR